MITWLYTVVDGATVRAPISLDGNAAVIDWLHVEPWYEPPSKVNDNPRSCYTLRVYMMQCDSCGAKQAQKFISQCRVCGDGRMRRIGEL